MAQVVSSPQKSQKIAQKTHKNRTNAGCDNLLAGYRFGAEFIF